MSISYVTPKPLNICPRLHLGQILRGLGITLLMHSSKPWFIYHMYYIMSPLFVKQYLVNITILVQNLISSILLSPGECYTINTINTCTYGAAKVHLKQNLLSERKCYTSQWTRNTCMQNTSDFPSWKCMCVYCSYALALNTNTNRHNSK